MSTAGPTLAPLERSSLRERVLVVLRTSITTGELEPGRLYSVGEFAERLEVSATPVREAVVNLANVGLVEIVRNRGFLVPDLTDQDLDEILQVRLFLEVPAIEQVAGRVPAETLTACHEHVRACKEAAEQGALIGFLDSDRAFHLTLIGSLGNRRLVEVLRGMRDQTRLYGLRDLAARGQLVASALEHETLLDAVEAGDTARARAEITRHLAHTRGSWAGRIERTTR
jgi:DNA-binding GntR family transcriptional regulator